MSQNFTKYAFTESVKAEQEIRGSRVSYARMEEKEQFKLSHRETSFINKQHGFYLSTVGENGWPYVQFRGGPTGFLKVIDNQALAYADFSGNMQYISTGNLNATKKAALILLDYSTRTRLKIWAETEILDPEKNPDLLEIVSDPNYKAKVDRIIVMHIKGFDWNCPQHITPKFTIEQMKDLVKQHPELLEELKPEG
ncbi:pyridoxamine 5'-phosphate oxidase family protein [Roseivirga sp.]|uniref:pyridoxamine 5'-phosphate oxidase family protein n=1 Tax=Roseivirga sp. TaxID=1964215 RepID=UPI003B8B2D97